MARQWHEIERRFSGCRWPVLRDGREQVCGDPRAGTAARRCGKHLDKRSLMARTLDPLGPYVREVEKIARQLEKNLQPQDLRPIR